MNEKQGMYDGGEKKIGEAVTMMQMVIRDSPLV